MVKKTGKKSRRIRLTCSNCRKVNYPNTRDVDSDCHFLCKTCDEAYFRWTMKSTSNIYVDDFLKTNAARQCKSTKNMVG
jgi:hypothetical protein